MKTLSRRAKEELAAIVPNNKYEALAEFSALVNTSGTINLSSSGIGLSITTDNSKLPELLNVLAMMAVLPLPQISYGKYTTITFEKGRELLELLKIFSGGEHSTRVEHIDGDLVRHDSEKRAYVRGAFLGAGFISAGKNNHMEFAFTVAKLRDDFLTLLPESLEARTGKRRDYYTVYFKSKERICDMLAYMGANKASLELHDEILFGSVERRAIAAQNCDVANIDRAVNAAEKHLRAIEKIDTKLGIEKLNDRLQTTALLRKSFPEANMSEIAEMLGVSKSCVKHRLEKIIEIAEML